MPLKKYKPTNQIITHLKEFVREKNLEPVSGNDTEKVLAESLYQEFQDWLILNKKSSYTFKTKFIGRSLSLFHNIKGSRGNLNEHLFDVNEKNTLW